MGGGSRGRRVSAAMSAGARARAPQAGSLLQRAFQELVGQVAKQWKESKLKQELRVSAGVESMALDGAVHGYL